MPLITIAYATAPVPLPPGSVMVTVGPALYPDPAAATV